MTNDIHIDVPSRHTPEMVREEVDSMLGLSSLRLCLGHVMLLAEAKSPYIYGGRCTPEDIELAMDILDAPQADVSEFHKALGRELDAAFRAWELIEPDDKPEREGKKSIIKAYSPEWCADILRSACRAVPSITLDDGLWHIPLAMMLHLGVSESRANGMTTRRPVDYKEALKRFKEMQKG